MRQVSLSRKISFIINERPIALKRHRHTKNNKTYDPQIQEKRYCQMLIKQQITNITSLNESLFCGPIAINIIFQFKLPKSKQAKKGKGFFYTHRPDLDNLLKFILDVMSNVIYADDAYIYKIDAIKCYGDKNKTEVIIKEVTQEPLGDTCIFKGEMNGIVKNLQMP